jgi:phi LC3 family holin
MTMFKHGKFLPEGGIRMNINWKLRFKNKTVLCAVIAQIAAIVYVALGFFGVVPTIAESSVVAFGGMVVELLVLLGVVVDPTTDGVSASVQAMGYQEPKK